MYVVTLCVLIYVRVSDGQLLFVIELCLLIDLHTIVLHTIVVHTIAHIVFTKGMVVNSPVSAHSYLYT